MLASKYRMTAVQAEAAQRQVEQRAAQDGLEFRMAGLRSGNPRHAHRLLHLAKAPDRQAELAERLYRAHFTEQASIFDHAALAGLAEESGLDRGEALSVLARNDYGEEVDTDEAMAQALGATGVPFFLIDPRTESPPQPAPLITHTLPPPSPETPAPAPPPPPTTAR